MCQYPQDNAVGLALESRMPSRASNKDYGSVPKVATPVAAATAGVGVAGAATAIALSNNNWYDHVANHAWAYGIGAGLVVLFISLAIYSYNNKDELSA